MLHLRKRILFGALFSSRDLSFLGNLNFSSSAASSTINFENEIDVSANNDITAIMATLQQIVHAQNQSLK